MRQGKCDLHLKRERSLSGKEVESQLLRNREGKSEGAVHL